jgi:hypothetical protein
MPAWGNIGSGNTGFIIQTNPGVQPQQTPEGLVVTRAQQLKDGWFGQIIIDREIVWESPESHQSSDAALREVNQRIVNKLKDMFRA